MRLAREGAPFVILFIGLAAAGWFVHEALAALFGMLLLYTLWFFRDPERRTPREQGALVSPADGKIIKADSAKISIFLNLFDVHVCRSPASGEVRAVEHLPGRFLAAYHDAASEQNERAAIVVVSHAATIRFTLVAGLIARRIVCKVVPGQRIEAGQRIGLIRFGSRVDVDLPPHAKSAVRLGQKVRAGETIIARLGAEPSTVDTPELEAI